MASIPSNAEIKASIANLLEQLAYHPDNADAHCDLGVVFQLDGQLDKAIHHYETSIRLNPQLSVAYSNLALALQQANRLDEAKSVCEQALGINPDLYEAHNNLGVVYTAQGQPAKAESAFRKSLGIQPGQPETWFNLAAAQLELKRFGDALESTKSGLKLHSPHLKGLFLQAQALQHLYRIPEALAAYEQTLQVNPQFTPALNNMGNLYKRLGRPRQAIDAYRKAVAANPQYALGYLNLGALYQEHLQLPDARAMFQKALLLQPGLPQAYQTVGDGYLYEGQVSEAIRQYDKALDLSSSDSLRLKIAAAVPSFYQSTEEIAYWRDYALDNLRELQGQKLSFTNPIAEIGSSLLYTVYNTLQDAVLQQSVAGVLANTPGLSSSFRFKRNRKPKIGFVSQFFTSSHPIARLYKPTIEALSQGAMEVHVFTIAAAASPFTEARIQHHPIPAEDLDWAQRRIADENLDMLIYTDNILEPMAYCLSFSRLARIQCIWQSGFCATAGIPDLDYVLSSKLFQPKGQEPYATSIVPLQGIPLVYPEPSLSQAYDRAHFGIRPHGALYLYPGSLLKCHPEDDDLLLQILRADATGQMVFINNGSEAWATLFQQRLTEKEADLRNRITFIHRPGWDEMLSLAQLADVVLSPPGEGLDEWAFISFSAGKPIATLQPKEGLACYGYALNQQAGLADCVAATKDAYLQTILKLSGDRRFYTKVASKMAKKRPQVFENLKAVRELEALLLQIIQAE